HGRGQVRRAGEGGRDHGEVAGRPGRGDRQAPGGLTPPAPAAAGRPPSGGLSALRGPAMASAPCLPPPQPSPASGGGGGRAAECPDSCPSPPPAGGGWEGGVPDRVAAEAPPPQPS